MDYLYKMFPFVLCLVFFLNSAYALSNNLTPIIRGPTAPLQNVKLFDQNFFTKNVQISFLREAELKHGRLAMLASIMLPLTEQYSDKLGINVFQENPELISVGVSFMFVTEFISRIRGWENPKDKLFRLNDDYQTGDFEFPLLNENETSMESQMDKGLNNGRLAMIDVLGMITQELVTGKHILNLM